MNLFDYKELINNKPIHSATVNKENNPNLSVVSDVRIIENNAKRNGKFWHIKIR